MSIKHTKIFCDDCKNEFLLKSVDIKESFINLNGQVLKLVYFVCPKCNKIYRITLQDGRYQELKKDLEDTKARIRKNFGRQNEEFARVLNNMVNTKHQRLKNHLNNLNRKFPGTFIFVTSENNNEEKSIKYLP